MCARIAAQFLRYRNFVAAEDQVTAVFGLLHGVVTADIDRVPSLVENFGHTSHVH